MTLLRRFWDAAIWSTRGATDLDEGRRTPDRTSERAGGLWSAAGLDDSARPPRSSPRLATMGSRICGSRWSGAWAPSGAYAASLPPERRQALKAELRRRRRRRRAIGLTARAWVVTGTVPA